MRTLFLMAAAAVVLSVSVAQAAMPADGTLSPGTPELNYTYGPNAISNPSGTGELVCQSPILPCDAFALTVELPAGSPAYKLVIETSWTATDDDYDLYLLSSTGGDAGTSATGDNPERVEVNAVAGSYTVRLVPFLVTGSTANTKITLVPATVVTPTPGPTVPVVPPTGLAPRYKVHVSPPALANDAGEPTIGYNPLSKRGMYIAFTQANRITFVENLPPPADVLNETLPESCDAQWEDKSGTLTTLNTLDPLMYTDKTTGRTFNSQLSGANSLFEYSDDDGDNWTPGQIGPANGGADHQGMITGPYPAGSPLASNPLNPGYAFYYCSQSVAAAFCARSDDGGQTQGPGVIFKNFDCAAGGLHGHPQVAPDGTLYVPDSSQCIAGTGVNGSSGKVIAHVSTDAGLSFTQRVIPTSTGGAGSDPSIGIATDGTVYECYENADGRAHVAVSKDRGLTWINDTDIGAAEGLVATRFPAAIAGDPDRASCAFLGTKTEGPNLSLAFEGVWYPYIATTYDGGLSWHLINLSPNDPVQGFGGIGTSGTNRNLLDFNDLEIDERGRTLFAYADGCTNGCVIDPTANSFASKGTIARQTGGRTLFAAFDDAADTQYNSSVPLKTTAACAVQDKSKRTVNRTRVVWNQPDTGGSPVTNYEVQRATSAAGPFSPVGNAGVKTNFVDATADLAVEKYFYRVVAENLLGKAVPGNIIELPITEEEIVNSCALPGTLLATDPVDQQIADLDAVSLSIAEPLEYEGNVVITLKIAGFEAGRPAGIFYGILFPTKGNTYVALDTTQAAPSFESGTFTELPQGLLSFTRAAALDPRSSFGADGTIVLVVPRSVFGDLDVGRVLAGFDVRIRAGSETATSRDTIGPADYQFRGTAICLPNVAPIASLLTDRDSAKPGDTVTFTIGGSDADMGDTIAKFSLSFGDDSPAITDRDVTTLPVTVTHQYAAVGNYMARLTVTDSRGLVSSNVASKFLNISSTPGTGSPGSGNPGTIGGAPAAGAGSLSSGRFGGGAFGLALLPLALMALRRRRRQ